MAGGHGAKGPEESEGGSNLLHCGGQGGAVSIIFLTTSRAILPRPCILSRKNIAPRGQKLIWGMGYFAFIRVEHRYTYINRSRHIYGIEIS